MPQGHESCHRKEALQACDSQLHSLVAPWFRLDQRSPRAGALVSWARPGKLASSRAGPSGPASSLWRSAIPQEELSFWHRGAANPLGLLLPGALDRTQAGLVSQALPWLVSGRRMLTMETQTTTTTTAPTTTTGSFPTPTGTRISK